jgi:hypothetical protein
MTTSNLIEMFREFDGIWSEFVKELSKVNCYKEFGDLVMLQERLSDFVESLPKTSHSWKLIESYSFYRDKLTQDGIDWFVLNIKPLFEKLNTPDSETIKLEDSSQIYFASILLKDKVLPDRLSFALADVILNTLNESQEKKYTLNSLFLTPPEAGRKKGSGVKEPLVMRKYFRLIKLSMKKSEIYSAIANEHYVSDDTIRRIVERKLKMLNSKDSLAKWLIDRCKLIKNSRTKSEKDKLISHLNEDLIQIEKDGNSTFHLGLKWHIDLAKEINNNRATPEEQPLIKYIELINSASERFHVSTGKFKK